MYLRRSPSNPRPFALLCKDDGRWMLTDMQGIHVWDSSYNGYNYEPRACVETAPSIDYGHIKMLRIETTFEKVECALCGGDMTHDLDRDKCFNCGDNFCVDCLEAGHGVCHNCTNPS